MKIKISLSLISILVLICINVSTINNFIFKNKYLVAVDNVSMEYIDGSFRKALYSYGIARGINALISLFKGTELDLSPAGVGITVALGEILDPIDDLVERFSWVMLASLISLGIQRFIVEISPYLSVNVFLNMFFCLLLLIVWSPRLKETKLPNITLKLLIAAIILRLLIPTFSYANNLIYDLFLSEEYDNTVLSLEIDKKELEGSYDKMNIEDATVFGNIKGLFTNKSNIKESLNKLKGKTVLITDHLINLLIVFIIHTMVTPLLLLWLIVKFLSKLFSIEIPINYGKVLGKRRGR